MTMGILDTYQGLCTSTIYCSITVQISVVSILQQSRESQEIRKGFKILKATPFSSCYEEGKKGSRLGELAILKRCSLSSLRLVSI